MADRIRIFNRSGTLTAEFTATCTRSWVIGDKSTASITVSVFDTFVTETAFMHGNWLLVENASLPQWIGTIGSHAWSPRSLTITAFSPEFLLGQRIGQTEKKINGSAGDIFAEIIEQANRTEQTLLRAGNIYKGDSRQETINPTKLAEDLKRVYERSKEEYSWRAGFTAGGNLLVYGDWYKTLGVQTNFVLQEGTSGGNIEATSRPLVSDSPEGNYVLAYGNGSTWLSKPQAAARNDTSINKYGLIQKSVSYYGVKTLDGLTKNALDELSTAKYPKNVYNVNVLNVGDAFNYIALGNSMFLKMQNIGFTNGNIGTDTRVRITGLMYNPENSGKIELALEDDLA